MVAQSDDICAGTEDLFCLLRGDSDDICILTVYHGKYDVMRFFEVLQMILEELKSGNAADIAYGKNVDQHNGRLKWMDKTLKYFIIFFYDAQ